MCQNKSAKIYSEKIITVCNAVLFRLCIDLMHILPPVTVEGFDGSHHPRFAEWGYKVTGRFHFNKKNQIWNISTYSELVTALMLNLNMTIAILQPAVLKTAQERLLKPLRKNEKMLVTRAFSISRNVFYCLKSGFLLALGDEIYRLQMLLIWTNPEVCLTFSQKSPGFYVSAVHVF